MSIKYSRALRRSTTAEKSAHSRVFVLWTILLTWISFCLIGFVLMWSGYTLPWEDPTFEYSSTLARPLVIAVEASNGASDYGNKFGEPILGGFARSFGQLLPSGERREWIKPIMFTGGVGSICDLHVTKQEPQLGMSACLCACMLVCWLLCTCVSASQYLVYSVASRNCA